MAPICTDEEQADEQALLFVSFSMERVFGADSAQLLSAPKTRRPSAGFAKKIASQMSLAHVSILHGLLRRLMTARTKIATRSDFGSLPARRTSGNRPRDA